MANKKTRSERRAERRLDKITRRNAPDAFAAELSLVTAPGLYGLIEQVCRRYLTMSQFDTPSRELIARLALAFRQEAFTRFGHDTPETFALAKLLKSGPVKQAAPAGRLDCLSHIQAYPNKASRLDVNQFTAAEYIQSVWEAFGKFLVIGNRAMEGGATNRTHALGPLDVMGEELWRHYRTIYCPWQETARKAAVARAGAGGTITIAAIVFKILVEDFHPEQIDSGFALVKGSALKALKRGLSAYWDPARLLDPAKTGKSGARAGEPGEFRLGERKSA